MSGRQHYLLFEMDMAKAGGPYRLQRFVLPCYVQKWGIGKWVVPYRLSITHMIVVVVYTFDILLSCIIWSYCNLEKHDDRFDVTIVHPSNCEHRRSSHGNVLDTPKLFDGKS